MAPTPSPDSTPPASGYSHLRLGVKRLVVSESTFPNKSSLDNIASHLHALRATGKLTINFSQGGVNSVSFEARQSINGDSRVEIVFTDL